MAINTYKEFERGDDRKILAYALFSGNTYQPPLGVNSLIASADTSAELKALPEVASCDEFSDWQIIRTDTFQITDYGNYEGPEMTDGVEIL